MKNKTTNQFRTLLAHAIPVVFLFFVVGTISSFAAAVKPERIELAENWKLSSATEAKAEGAAKWADMTALNTMPIVPVEITATQSKVGKESHVTIRLRNPSERIAFFERATISTKRDGDEILPFLYDDNYVTVFPGETVEIHVVVRKDVKPRWVKLEGYNTPAVSVSIK
jgi:hypothetical protein